MRAFYVAFDRHTTYVALSRHREAATLFYARDDFGGGFDPEAGQARLVERLSRAQAKDLAHDYLEREGAEAVITQPVVEPVVGPSIEQPKAMEAIRAAARERWRRYREQQAMPQPASSSGQGGPTREGPPSRETPEDDLSL